MLHTPTSETHEYLFKFIMLGDTNVGKTRVLKRFTSNIFVDNLGATIGVDFDHRIIDIEDKGDKSKHPVQIITWDTAGQEAYRSISKPYYRGCAAVLLVYDITHPATFRNVDRWLHDVREYNTNENIVYVLVGNKADLDDRRAVSKEMAQEYATANQMLFFEVSAKNDTGVQEMFLTAASQVYEKLRAGVIDVTDKQTGVSLSESQNREQEPRPLSPWVKLRTRCSC